MPSDNGGIGNASILPRILLGLLSSNVLLVSAIIKGTRTFQSCKAGCSPHITLPCDFGSLDRCIMQSCRDACWKDDYRKVHSCFCRGSVEGPTLRACFCGPSIRKSSRPKKTLFLL